jgi:hypothetical protein
MLFVVDQTEALLCVHELVELDDPNFFTWRLHFIYEGANRMDRIGVPRSIQTDSRYFHDTFKDALGEVGIQVRFFDRIPTLEGCRRITVDHFEREERSGGARRR